MQYTRKYMSRSWLSSPTLGLYTRYDYTVHPEGTNSGQERPSVTISASLAENGLYDFARSRTDSIPRTEYSVMVYGEVRVSPSRRASPRMNCTILYEAVQIPYPV